MLVYTHALHQLQLVKFHAAPNYPFKVRIRFFKFLDFFFFFEINYLNNYFLGTVNQLAREPEKPKLTTESKDSEAGIGGTAMLEAKILGFPKPSVKWYHDGQEIKASGRFKFLFEDDESMTLVIKNVVADDAGIYKIVAKNELGEDTTELKLTVKGNFRKKGVFRKSCEEFYQYLIFFSAA